MYSQEGCTLIKEKAKTFLLKGEIPSRPSNRSDRSLAKISLKGIIYRWFNTSLICMGPHLYWSVVAESCWY